MFTGSLGKKNYVGAEQQCHFVVQFLCVKIFDIYYGIKHPVSVKLEYCLCMILASFMGSVSKGSRLW